MQQKPRIGIIGGGMIAQVCHIPFYLNSPDCELRTVSESRPSLVKYLKEHFGIKNVVADYRDILNDNEIDAVILSAPRQAVGPLTLECLKAGKHVLTEKPMAHSVAQAQELVAAAKEKNLTYAIGFMKRSDPGILRAKEKFDELKKTSQLGALLSARFYDHSKSTVFSPPPHQRPQESRTERFATWPTYPEWMPEYLRDNFAWFMNTASHDIDLISCFFQSDIKIMESYVTSSGSVSAILRKGDTLISLETSKSEAGEWLQGAEFIYEKGPSFN